MRKNIVITLTGPDKPGIVDSVTEILFKHDGNVETSRMIRLGGEFGILMLVSLPSEGVEAVDDAVCSLMGKGYKITTSQTEQSYIQKYLGWSPFRIEVQGADHEGIIHHVAHYLSERGINIKSMDTETTKAPMSGAPLFKMVSQVVVPPELAKLDWEADLDDVGHHLNVDIKVTVLK